MARTVLLNNVDHRDLRIDTRRDTALGDAAMSAITYPREFRDIQAHYPIVFSKTADGGFQPVALFGFSEGQNLFLGADGWNASYVPLAVERQPFLIGMDGDEAMVHVDLDSPRIGRERGEPVFREHGGTTEYLDRVTSILLALHEGLLQTKAFVAHLLTHDLLESFVLDIELDDGSQNRLSGFYTINEDRLRLLDAAALGQLSAAGHLEPVYMAIASLSHFRDLIDRVNRLARADG